MEKVYVIYWTQSGNTEAMAAAVGDGVKEAGKEAVLINPSEADINELKNLPGFAMGCPAMGAEVLEESEMEPFVAAIEPLVSGKTLALFGSYGWGDGQWMRDWTERMIAAGAEVIGNEGVISQEAPGANEIDSCKELGKILAGI